MIFSFQTYNNARTRIEILYQVDSGHVFRNFSGVGGE